MSGLPAKIVCQVSGVARLPTGWLMKGFKGESGWGSGGGQKRGVKGVGWASPLVPVSSQLLIHSSFTTTTNRGHTRAGQQSEAGQDTGRQICAPPSPFLYCRYKNRAVLLFPSLSPPFSNLLLLLLSWLHLLPLSSILLLSPASMERIYSWRSLTPSEGTGCKTSHCSEAATIRLAADSRGSQRLPQHAFCGCATVVGGGGTKHHNSW